MVATLKRQRQLVEKKKFDSKPTCSNFNFNLDKSHKEFDYAIILPEYPQSIVEHLGFHKFIADLKYYFKMISRNTNKKDIVKVYNQVSAFSFSIRIVNLN